MSALRIWGPRLIWLVLWALIGCGRDSPASVAKQSLADRLDALGPRVVLVYVDLSASVPATVWDRPLLRLATELSPGDRVVLYPIHERAPDGPLLDTLIAGSGADRLSATLGLSTRESRRRHQDATEALGSALATAAHGARALARVPRTAIIDAVCHAATVAQSTTTGGDVVAVMMTDGIEESQYANTALQAPTVTHAIALARRLRSRGVCATKGAWPRIRIVGVRHASDTPSLIRWWLALLGALGYTAALGDVSTYPLGPILGDGGSGARVARDPGPGGSRPHAGS